MKPVVMITGAAGALGRAVAQRFAADGARVYVLNSGGTPNVAAFWLCRNASGAPSAMTRPACMKATRSHRSASLMKCVEIKIVTSLSRASLSISCQNASRAAGSTPEVGSSRISTSGSCKIAIASDRRWRTPSGNAPAMALAWGLRPNCSLSAAMRSAPLSSSRPKSLA